MDSIDIHAGQQAQLWRLISAILHFGNVHYEVDEEGSVNGIARASVDTHQFVAQLLGVDPGTLQRSVCEKTMQIGGQTIMRSQDLPQVNNQKNDINSKIADRDDYEF